MTEYGIYGYHHRRQLFPSLPDWATSGCLLYFINDLTNHAKSCGMSLRDDSSDGSRLLKEITSMTDWQLAQKDLDSVCVWCKTWPVKLNAVKCCIMSVTNTKKLITYDSIISSQSLPKFTAIKNLGVKLTDR